MADQVKPRSLEELIDSFDKEIAEYSQKIFQAQGAKMAALYIKENFEVKLKDASSSSVR